MSEVNHEICLFCRYWKDGMCTSTNEKRDRKDDCWRWQAKPAATVVYQK